MARTKTKKATKKPTLKIRNGDIVQIMSGKDSGKRGRVIEAYPRERRVLVENLNTVKKHRKPKVLRDTGRMGQQSFQEGGIVDLASPVPISNVMIVCPGCDRPTRVGYEMRDGKEGPEKTRVCAHTDCREKLTRV